VYVGYGMALAIVGALAVPASRPWGLLAIAALIGANFQSELGPERFLLLVPLVGAVGAFAALRRVAPRSLPALSVLCAAAWIGEGWKGEPVDLPLPRSPVRIPDVVRAVTEGPVLDLPASPGGAMRGLWFQTAHGQTIAVDADGRLGPQLMPTVRSISADACPDLAALGFRTLIARREAEFHEISALVKCYGTPGADDGKVAVWRLGSGQQSAASDQPDGRGDQRSAVSGQPEGRGDQRSAIGDQPDGTR
jgi:hypothetical protein